MRVVVTGGAGFVGANLVRALIADPQVEQVAAIDDLSTGDARNLDALPVTLHVGSVLDEALLHRVLAPADAVVHLAALPSVPRSVDAPVPTHEANATGTLRVLEAARAVGAHVIVASSSSVYGAAAALPLRESGPVAPVSPYAASKLSAEAYALSYASVYDLPVLVFRFFNVYGPRQPVGHAYGRVVPAFVDAALTGRPLPVHGDGRQTRDFTFVGDVTAVLLDALRRRVTCPRPVNLAFGGRHSLLDIAAALEEILGTPLAREHLPVRPGDVRDTQADSSSLRRLFPAAAPVDLHAGLKATVAWWCGAALPGAA